MLRVMYIILVSRKHSDRCEFFVLREIRLPDVLGVLRRRAVHLDPAIVAARYAERLAFAEYRGMHIFRNGQRVLIFPDRDKVGCFLGVTVGIDDDQRVDMMAGQGNMREILL